MNIRQVFFEVKENVKCRCNDVKKSKCFVRKKNLSVRRKKEFFKVWRGGKNVSVELRVFGKKRNWKKEKFREKKSKFFLVKILLSSCSLVGFFCGKEMFLKFGKKKFWVCVTPLVGHHVD